MVQGQKSVSVYEIKYHFPTLITIVFTCFLWYITVIEHSFELGPEFPWLRLIPMLFLATSLLMLYISTWNEADYSHAAKAFKINFVILVFCFALILVFCISDAPFHFFKALFYLASHTIVAWTLILSILKIIIILCWFKITRWIRDH